MLFTIIGMIFLILMFLAALNDLSETAGIALVLGIIFLIIGGFTSPSPDLIKVMQPVIIQTQCPHCKLSGASLTNINTTVELP